MTKHYFTFGFGQKHESGYHVIEAMNVTEALAEMHRRFSNKWAFHYNSAEEAGVDRFGLLEVFYPMYTVQMFEDVSRVEELEADFRTLEAACVYVMDCIKTLNASRIEQISDSPCSVLGYVRDSVGKIIWYTSSAFAPNTLEAVYLKMHLLIPEELEHIEFTVDAFLKRREHEDEKGE